MVGPLQLYLRRPNPTLTLIYLWLRSNDQRIELSSRWINEWP